MMKHVTFLAGLFLTPLIGAQGPATTIPVIDEAPTKAKSYDWMARHEAVVKRVKQGHVDLILIGDSITHGWGGVPAQGWRDKGDDMWDKYFAPRNAVNLGFGWDRTQHVLWRLDNGEIDGISPKVAVVMIGTNNIGSDKPMDIVRGISAILGRLHKKLPQTRVLLLGIFPRDQKPETFNRKQIAEVNANLANFANLPGVLYLDLSPIFLQPDGTISPEIMPDFLHPSPKGYELWAKAMEPTLARLFGDKAK